MPTTASPALNVSITLYQRERERRNWHFSLKMLGIENAAKARWGDPFRVRPVGRVRCLTCRHRYTCVLVTFGAANGSDGHFCFSQVGLNKAARVTEINTPQWSERGWMTDTREMDRDTFWTAVLNHALRMRSMSASEGLFITVFHVARRLLPQMPDISLH